MLFDISADDVARAVEGSPIHRVSQDAAVRYGFHGEALHLLSRVGLPQIHEMELNFTIGRDFSEDYFCSHIQLQELGWNVNSEVNEWVKLGFFPINMVAVSPRDGIVYQFTEGPMVAQPIHGDLSSFITTIIMAKTAMSQCAEASAEADAEELMAQRVATIRGRISEIDPLPFGSPTSEWNEIFDNLEAGIYA